MTASRPPTVAEEFRGAGLRATAVRVAPLDTVRQGGRFAAGALASRARRHPGHVPPQAVYEALDAPTDAGLVRRVEPAGGPARHEDRVGGNTTTWCAVPTASSPTSTARSVARPV
ncbi:hypothetical protein [Streptomyces pimonensis]|uniref:hypothetical protein n=1 Tax=Streptomyces pimonensis TaxID=2860288 RepID=UPI0035276648